MARTRLSIVFCPLLLAEIIRRLGGSGAVARRLGMTRNAPQKWIDRGWIPTDRLEDLRALLREIGSGPAG